MYKVFQLKSTVINRIIIMHPFDKTLMCINSIIHGIRGICQVISGNRAPVSSVLVHSLGRRGRF